MRVRTRGPVALFLKMRLVIAKTSVLGIWMIFWLGLPRPASSILFYSTGDPTHNTTAPTGSLTNSGWQYQGTWGPYLGTPVAPKYFITASHVGGAVGDRFQFRGLEYTTTSMFDDPSSDLRLWSICGRLTGATKLKTNKAQQREVRRTARPHRRLRENARMNSEFPRLLPPSLETAVGLI